MPTLAMHAKCIDRIQFSNCMNIVAFFVPTIYFIEYILRI